MKLMPKIARMLTFLGLMISIISSTDQMLHWHFNTPFEFSMRVFGYIGFAMFGAGTVLNWGEDE